GRVRALRDSHFTSQTSALESSPRTWRNRIPAGSSGIYTSKTGNHSLTLFGGLQLVSLHFPFDAHQKIEMHAFRFEPSFQRLARFRAKLHKHFPFKHVDQHALGARRPSGLHALRKSLRSLPREASECVLRKVAWHRNSS